VASLKIFLRRTRTLLWTAISITIIFAAVLVGVGKLLMPYSDRYQPNLEAWLSDEFGQSVTLESFKGEWNAFGPRLSLRGLRIQTSAGGSGAVAIAEAAVDLKPLNFFLSGRALYNFLVIGADFKLVHTKDGLYALSGFGVGAADSEEEVSVFKHLVGIGELILENSNLEYIDEMRDVRLRLSAIDARLQIDGDSVSLKMQANLSDEMTGRVYGEVDATGLLQLAQSRGLEEARWQFSIGDLLLPAFQGRLPPNPFLPQEGRINAEFWCDWVSGRPLHVRGVVDLRDGHLVNGEQDIFVEHLNTRLGWEFSGRGEWRLDFDDLHYDAGETSWTTPSLAIARNIDKDLGLWISADYLPLDVPLSLARDIMSIYGTAWPTFLPNAATGSVSHLELMLDSSWGLRQVKGSARQASISQWGNWPDIRGIDGEINLGYGFGSLNLHANQLELNWPRMFQEPLAFSFPDCNIDLAWGEQWQVGFKGCRLLNDDIAVLGDVVIASNVGRPAVDINVQIPRARLDNISPYWPQGIIRENVVNWLRRGLVAGEIQNSRFLIHGDMDDWPFREGKGRFEALARVGKVDLDYFPGWPFAEGVEATARFEAASLSVEGSINNVGGVSAQHVTAEIADLKYPLLKVNYSAQSGLDKLVGFVMASPLEERLDTDLSRFDFSGPADTTGLLQVPLGKTPGQLEVDGTVVLQEDDFTDPESEVTLGAIKGELHYTREGIFGTGLRAQFKGKPARLDLAGDSEAAERFRVDVTGSFDVQEILPQFLIEGYSELQRVQGESAWTVSVVVPEATPEQDSAANLIIKSDLVGVVMGLPAPLRKEAGETWPFELNYPLSGPSGLLDVHLLDRMLLRMDFPRSDSGTDEEAEISRALIQFGKGTTEMPTPGLIRISGEPDELDLDGWVDLIVDGANQGKGLDGLDIEQCVLNTAQLRFLDRHFADVNVIVDVGEKDIKAKFAAEDITGHVVFNPDSGTTGSLSAEFERLALAKPVTSGLDMQADPGELPALHLYAKSFRYSGIEMGETRIEAYPSAGGFHFEKVETESDDLTIRASGDWALHDKRQRSDFNILVTAESLGEFLQSMDISSSLAGGQTVLRFNAWWPGSPATFGLSKLNGEIDFSVSRGQITNASAGGGRLLGLLSIQALPRRLSLDFRDVFDSGFDFEEAKGTFQMENGTARTDDVVLSSSAAKISMSGSTDLVAQKYDQVMTVRPGLGNTLPVIGAIAGGPGGAAAGLALQGLLHEQLGEASQVQYTISGNWDEPLIEPVLKDKSGDEKADG
jgi:uncharacterized protein (TIGR02099 family)